MLLSSFADVMIDFVSSPMMLGLVALGTVLGLVLGAIPGISSTMALAILMPVTFTMEPGVAILFLISVFMSSVYGGSISAILMKLPGTPASIFTQVDGYPMAQKGRAGHALNFALVASTVGGMVGLAMLILLAPVLAGFATNFRSPEFAAVALFGIVMLSFASNGSTLVASVGRLYRRGTWYGRIRCTYRCAAYDAQHADVAIWIEPDPGHHWFVWSG